MVQLLGTMAIAFLGLIAVLCLVLRLVCTFLAISWRKPGVSLWRDTLLNPVNLLSQPEKLTDAGLAARAFANLGCLGFVVCMLLFMVIGCATGVLKSSHRASSQAAPTEHVFSQEALP